MTKRGDYLVMVVTLVCLVIYLVTNKSVMDIRPHFDQHNVRGQR